MTPTDIAATSDPSSAGARAALSEHERLRSSFDQPVDIFDVVERARIWLMFQPLKDLYGAYERVGDAAGIIVNSKHPISLQRFTAAHEYGHHVLGHDLSLDQEDDILPEAADSATPDARETGAQAFAAFFLMPPPLVDAAWERLRLPSGNGAVSATDVYRLSLELGVSYAATVKHLAALGRLSRDAAARLRRERPARIKADLAGLTEVRSQRADLWTIDERDVGRVLHPRVSDEIYARLAENPSTGYIWTIARPDPVDLRRLSESVRSDESVLGLVSDRFEPAGGRQTGIRIGAAGTRSLVLRVLRPGRYTLRLVKRRPWQSTQPVASLEVALVVSGRRTGYTTRGLSARQKPLVVHA